MPAFVDDEGVFSHAASAAVAGVVGLARFYPAMQEADVSMKPLAQLLQVLSGKRWRQPIFLGGFGCIGVEDAEFTIDKLKLYRKNQCQLKLQRRLRRFLH